MNYTEAFYLHIVHERKLNSLVLEEAIKLIRLLDGPLQIKEHSEYGLKASELHPLESQYPKLERWKDWKVQPPPPPNLHSHEVMQSTEQSYDPHSHEMFFPHCESFKVDPFKEPEFIEPEIDPEPHGVEPIEFLSKRVEKAYYQAAKSKGFDPQNSMVLLITDVYNSLNAFSGRHHHLPNARFLQINHPLTRLMAEKNPEHGSTPHLPVAYELITFPLRHFVFRTREKALKFQHKIPRGCMNDYCSNHRETELKLRTGDLCMECAGEVAKAKVPHALYKQTLEGMELIRQKQLNFRKLRSEIEQVKLVLDRHLVIEQLGMSIPLSPKERALYFVFANHPEGIALKELSDHRLTLEKAYSRYYTYSSRAAFKKEGNIKERISQTIERLVMNTDSDCSQTISKINRKIRNSLEPLGEYRPYQILGEDGGLKRIHASVVAR